MALTKPKLSQNIDTDISVFNDPILVLHQGSTSANLDVGFLMNRSNGLTANAAVIWQESTRSFVHILTNSSGVDNSNLAVQSYANVSVGNVLLINNAGIYVDGTLGSAGQILASDGSKTYWAAPGGFTGGVVPNPSVFQSNLVVSSTTDSTSATTGALVVLGGMGIGSNVTFAGNTTSAGKLIITESTNAEPYIMGSGAFHVAGGMSIGKDFWVGGNLYVANVISQTSEIIQVQDPLVYLRGNNFPYNYDIGVFSDFTGGSYGLNQYTGAVRSYQTNEWVFFSNIDIAPASGTIGLTNTKVIYDPVKVGNLVVANTTTSTSTSTGALIVRGGAGIAGNVYTDKLYTTNGLYWSGNGEVIVTGGGGTTLTEENYGAITDSATLTDDWGLVTDAADTTVDYGSIGADIVGVIDGNIIVIDSIPGNRLTSTTDVTVANVTATNTVYADTIYVNTATNTVNFSATGQAAFGNSAPTTAAGIYNDQNYSVNATRYGLFNRTLVDDFTLTADRTTYATYNLLETKLQNSLAYSHNIYGTYNVIRTSTVSGNTLNGEGYMYGTYNYVYNQSDDPTYNRQEAAYGTYNYVYSQGDTSLIDRAYGSYNYIRTAGTADSDTPGINTSYGVYSTVNVGANRSIGTHYGVYVTGTLTGSITGSAYGIYVDPAWMTNYFGGDVQVIGSLSKGSGSFKIDHPLPEKENTHHLVHSFVESPQADLIYRGKVTLSNGQAQVNIDQAAGMTDGTFVALCRDVQCFTSNESDWDAVKGTVVENMLIINSQNSSSGATISWLVIGERQDKHMFEAKWTDSTGKVIVEPLKNNLEQSNH